jgi:hypothetical protein
VPFRVRWIFAAIIFALATLSLAQDRKWYFNAFAGQSVIFLGSKDNRTLTGVGATYSFGNRARLRWGQQPGNLLGEMYYNVSEGPGWGNRPANSAQAWGVLAYARYHWTEPGAPRMFADIGWGIQVGSRATRDLSSKLNSTPLFDLGVVIGSDHERTLVGVRYMHISNGGSVHRNKGQNELFLFVQLPL